LTLTDADLMRKITARKTRPFCRGGRHQKNVEDAARWLEQDSSEVRAYLYSLSSQCLVTPFDNGNIRMADFHHLYTDGAVLPEDGLQTKIFNSVPLILLGNASEFSLFAVKDSYFSEAKKNGTLLTDPPHGSVLYYYANVDDRPKPLGTPTRLPSTRWT
jgi:para-nitrobenzyl esterase